MTKTKAKGARPPFIIASGDIPEETDRYPGSDEALAPSRPIGIKAGLRRIGLHLCRVPPGVRTSWPHAEQNEEEFVYVIAGEVDCWVDGELHRMRAGDLAAFPCGTGISHVFLNDGPEEATLLVGGEAGKRDSKIFYPLHPDRERNVPWSAWWHDIPKRPLGPHDGLPAAQRRQKRPPVTSRKK